jgi:hypothetical protein
VVVVLWALLPNERAVLLQMRIDSTQVAGRGKVLKGSECEKAGKCYLAVRRPCAFEGIWDRCMNEIGDSSVCVKISGIKWEKKSRLLTGLDSGE